MADIKRFIQNGDYYVFGNASSEVKSISLDKSEITLISVGQTSQLTATVLPTTAVDKSVTWSSSDTSIATVDNTGLVTCVSSGECTITATTSNGLTATCAIKSPILLDFTTDDICTFIYRQNSYTGYGWTSGKGYYSSIQNSSYYRTNTVWKLPDTVYSGTISTLKIELNVPNNYSGGGINIDGSSGPNYYWGLSAINANTTNRMHKGGSSSVTLYTYTYSSGIQTLVIDLGNLTMYVEGNASTPISLTSSEVAQMQAARASKTLYLNAVANYPNGSGYTTYIRKLEITKNSI